MFSRSHIEKRKAAMADIIVNPCFNDDPLDGYTAIELPSEEYLRAYWDVDILRDDLQPARKIITSSKAFVVRFRVVLVGELWYCFCGNWCFNLGFTAIGDGRNFNLSDLVGKNKLQIDNWRGCDRPCVELLVTVPAGTIPTDYCGTLYECGGWFELHCCGKGPVAVVGMEPLEERFFFRDDALMSAPATAPAAAQAATAPAAGSGQPCQ
jgi:hypothetical protein